MVRAFQEGYRQQSVTIPMKSRKTELVINLEPLPNALKAVAHRYFAGRSTLVFLTVESPTFRVQEKTDGFGLILSETAQSAEAFASIGGLLSPMVASASSQQVGEDLVVNLKFADEQEIELRSRLDHDVARGLYAFSLDLLPAAGVGDSIAAAQAALSRLESEHVTGCNLDFDRTLHSLLDSGALSPEHVTGCNLDFDRTLHSLLDSGALSRALTPKGDFTDPYLRAAMRRLGELSPDEGGVEFSGGIVYRPTVPIELEVALSQAAEARGFLALLWQFVSELEAPPHRRATFGSLVAPEMDPLSFGVIMDKAEESKRSCVASL
ncbi:MAG: hypothetical protein JRG94_19930 [Deltaproteobacteria bacterium]|nr:hypothetical protein [Deltaproteobacteria bacterium]